MLLTELIFVARGVVGEARVAGSQPLVQLDARVVDWLEIRPRASSA